MKEKITISVEGVVNTHIAGGSPEYSTLCGMECDDPAIGVKTVITLIGAKIDCHHCKTLWEEAKKWKESDFSCQ